MCMFQFPILLLTSPPRSPPILLRLLHACVALALGARLPGRHALATAAALPGRRAALIDPLQPPPIRPASLLAAEE
eukprot:2343676-Pyramimonas_sp.AAC.1